MVYLQLSDGLSTETVAVRVLDPANAHLAYLLYKCVSLSALLQQQLTPPEPSDHYPQLYCIIDEFERTDAWLRITTSPKEESCPHIDMRAAERTFMAMLLAHKL